MYTKRLPKFIGSPPEESKTNFTTLLARSISNIHSGSTKVTFFSNESGDANFRGPRTISLKRENLTFEPSKMKQQQKKLYNIGL